MASPLEDYALLSDMQTGPLVSRRGSIDWLCVPRYDSPSVFGALLGDADDGRWLLAPAATADDEGRDLPVEQWRDECRVGDRFYAEHTFVLHTVWITATGSVRVTDFMPLSPQLDIARRVEGLTGEVEMIQDLRLRFGYGRTVPWISHFAGAEDPETGEPGEDELIAMAGPDAMVLRSEVAPERIEDEGGPRHVSRFTVSAGQTRDLVLTHFESHRQPPAMLDVGDELRTALETWREWDAQWPGSGQAAEGEREDAEDGEPSEPSYGGAAAESEDVPLLDLREREEAVRRSLLVVRALMHQRSGGLVASTSTSLPERIGGERNWDARYSWLRDGAQALEVMLDHGHDREALQLRNWLLRSVAGHTDDIQSVYGVGSERGTGEHTMDLSGYERSRPVRVGNSSSGRLQSDTAGYLLVAFEKLRRRGLEEDQLSWPIQKALLGHVIAGFEEADQGIWEMRGDRGFHTHSRVMMWAALQAGVDAVRVHGLDGDLQLWESHRDQLALEIWTSGYDPAVGSFVQRYGSQSVDASLLQLPSLGFVAWDDERMVRTAERIVSELGTDLGGLRRYENIAVPPGADPEEFEAQIGQDGFAGPDSPHVGVTLWLATYQARSGRLDEARRTLARVVRRGSDLGLFSTVYEGEPGRGGRMLGNLPHVVSHLGLIQAVGALDLAEGRRPAPVAHDRPEDDPEAPEQEDLTRER
ncbi:glycoside hydrolase family 15 protein [Kocuria palustris]|uniref:glycoside hydrolase family 15 protein n=1 Tax=Kocuria palustris TaxID=71999 RepID=UPI00119CE60B|nr:glycoside hydrolase family 15 protein [Kocuria palustris]